MKLNLSFIMLFFVMCLQSVRAQTEGEKLLTENYVPDEMVAFFEGIKFNREVPYIKSKGFTYDRWDKEDQCYLYDSEAKIKLGVSYLGSRLAVLAFSSSAQKFYQVKALLDRDYKRISDETDGGATFQRWEKNGFVFRASAKDYLILLSKESAFEGPASSLPYHRKIDSEGNVVFKYTADLANALNENMTDAFLGVTSLPMKIGSLGKWHDTDNFVIFYADSRQKLYMHLYIPSDDPSAEKAKYVIKAAWNGQQTVQGNNRLFVFKFKHQSKGYHYDDLTVIVPQRSELIGKMIWRTMYNWREFLAN